MMRICAGILLLLVIGLLPGTVMAEFTRTRIAVLDFQMQGEDFGNKDMGSIVAEWFITALVKEGRFDVIERRLLERVLGEQKLAMTGMLDETSVTQIGQLLGVKVIISGSVMKVRDILEVNARIIDVENASIIAAENVKSSTASRLQDLIVEMSGKIIRNFPLEGYVVNRNDKKITIDLGSRTGVKPGMEFVVYREGEIIKHPKTGEVLDVRRINTGRVRIQSVLGKISEAEILGEEEDNAIKYGQLVSSVTSDRNKGSLNNATFAEQPRGRLYVSTDPADARIRILNIGPAYRDGIALTGGAYHLEVSAPGYRTDTQWVNVDSGGDKRVRVQLVPSSTVTPQQVSSSPPTPAGRSGNRYVSLLRSKSLRGKTDAGKLIVHNGIKDTATLDMVEQELLKGYVASGSDRNYVDAMSWLCKALGASGNGKYRATLEKVVQNAPHGKLKKYAKQSLDMLH